MEPLPGLEHVESELDLGAVSTRVDLAQCVLKVHPETGLLERRATRGISLQSSHLVVVGWFVHVLVGLGGGGQ